MKKFILTVFMMLTMSVYSFADDVKIADASKYEMKINHKRLASFLELTKDQLEWYDEALTKFENNMSFAGTMQNEDSSNRIVSNTLKLNLEEMRYILNKEQYKEYLKLINITLQNKGFNLLDINKEEK